MKRSNIIFNVLLAIILVLLYVLIFRQPATIVEPFDDTELREKLDEEAAKSLYWEQLATKWEQKALQEEAKSDSLEKIKSDITDDYSKTYDIIPDSDIDGLDSILFANW